MQHNSLEKTSGDSKDRHVIYTIGLLGSEGRRTKRAKKVLQEIAALRRRGDFRKIRGLHSICEQVAHDIRNQYTWPTPSNANRTQLPCVSSK